MGVEIQSMEPTLMKAVLTWLEPDAIDRIAALDIVKAISLPDYARNNSGSTTTQGDSILRANAARIRGFDGKGVKVGVISDGVNNRNVAAASGDLPQTSPGNGIAAVQVNPAIPGSGDEGTAMLEIIHDLAPGATLAFSGAPTTIDFLNAVNWLANTANCHVICDDVAYFGEPFFADGAAAQTCEAAIANGRTYVTSAGNFRQNHIQTGYTGVNFTPSFAGVPWNLNNWNGAGDHSLDIAVAASGASTTVTVFLQWDEPYGSATANYDLYIVNAAETAALAMSTSVQGGGYIFPFETASIVVPPSAVNQTFRIWIRKDPAAPNRNIEMFVLQSGGTAVISNLLEYNAPTGSIFGQAASVNVISCAAVGQSSGAPWCTTEYFSSTGPSVLTIPMLAVRQTPTLTAIDGVSVTGAGGFSNPFYGTSAASPHVAGVAALLKSAKPAATPTQIRTLLIQGAVDCGAPGYENDTGFGRVDAFASIGLACPGAGFECQPGACTYAFPVGLGVIGDCEGSSVNGAAGADGRLGSERSRLPDRRESVRADRRLRSGFGRRRRQRALPQARADDLDLGLLLRGGAVHGSLQRRHGDRRRGSGRQHGRRQPRVRRHLHAVRDFARQRRHLRNGALRCPGSRSAKGHGERDRRRRLRPNLRVERRRQHPAERGLGRHRPRATHRLLLGHPGTIGFTVSHGPKFGTYFAAISLAQGATPNGWFYGLDIPWHAHVRGGHGTSVLGAARSQRRLHVRSDLLPALRDAVVLGGGVHERRRDRISDHRELTGCDLLDPVAGTGMNDRVWSRWWRPRSSRPRPPRSFTSGFRDAPKGPG